MRSDQKHSQRSTGLLAPARAGHASKQDGQQGHPGIHQSSRGSVSLPQPHRPPAMEDVLKQQHPPHSSDLAIRRPTFSPDIPLPPNSFQLVQDLFSPHSVNLSATHDNRLLPRFASWRPDPESLATDAFVLPLKGESPCCFSRVPCIPRGRKVLYLQATVTLVAPDWAAPWMRCPTSGGCSSPRQYRWSAQTSKAGNSPVSGHLVRFRRPRPSARLQF